jgi:hypothetical protein
MGCISSKKQSEPEQIVIYQNDLAEFYQHMNNLLSHNQHNQNDESDVESVFEEPPEELADHHPNEPQVHFNPFENQNEHQQQQQNLNPFFQPSRTHG